MSNTIRTFIAIELPEKIIYTISKVQEEIKSCGLKIRWVRPENIHLTLKFLGDIKAADTENVARAVSESVTGYPPISLGVPPEPRCVKQLPVPPPPYVPLSILAPASGPLLPATPRRTAFHP